MRINYIKLFWLASIIKAAAVCAYKMATVSHESTTGDFGIYIVGDVPEPSFIIAKTDLRIKYSYYNQ
jgi:hypothetical protein